MKHAESLWEVMTYLFVMPEFYCYCLDCLERCSYRQRSMYSAHCLGIVFNFYRFPVPVKYGRNLARQVEKVRNSTVLQISSGSCINVKIGKTSFTEDQITENVVNSIDHIVKKIPEQWKNVKAISLLTSSSVALPIYNTIDESKTEVLDNQQ